MSENETVETRGDERVELLVGDTNNDGKPDLWAVDTDGDGKADLFQFDTNGDGKVDITMSDLDQDGNPVPVRRHHPDQPRQRHARRFAVRSASTPGPQAGNS